MASKKEQLSKRQRDILDFIWSYISHTSRPPTIREIGQEVQISSTSVVNYNLNKLKEKGYLQREAEVSRGLSLTPKARQLYTSVARAVQATAEALERTIRIPLVGDIVASEPVDIGSAEDAHAYDDEDVLELSANMVRGKPGELYALRVHGDSMIDAMINDGDLVVMQRANEVRDGDMVAVWLNTSGTTTLKHIFHEGDRVRLQPANPDLDAIYVAADDVQVQGKVMLVVRQTA